MFEAAGVARTERSIVNWCRPNRLGVARLDAYYDPNDRRYYLTPQSVELAIQEEKAKAAQRGQSPGSAEGITKQSDAGAKESAAEGEPTEVGELKREILDLKIANRGKDMFIEQLQKERETFAEERSDYVDKLMAFDHKVGELETRLLQLEGPDADTTIGARKPTPHFLPQ